MKKIIAILLLIVPILVQSQTWTARSGVSMTTGTNGFYEFLPSTYNGTTKLPALIFIHGLGEVGNGTTELSNLLSFGLPNAIQNDISGYNALGMVIICPQFNVSYPGGFTIENVIDYVRANYSIDTTRLYLTGMSMGGGTILDWGAVGSIYKIAAMVPVCPQSIWQSFGERYKAYGMPFWFFHSDDDGTVAFTNSTGWLSNLNQAPGIAPYARMDSLTGVGHNAWDAAYDLNRNTGNGTNVFVWMKSKKRTDYDGNGVDDGNNFVYNPSPPGSSVYKMNLVASGTPVTNAAGWTKLPDASISGGVWLNTYDVWGTDQVITGATVASDTIYKSGRRTSVGITINHPVDNGTYTLRLHFCEFWKNDADDVFNVDVEGARVLTGFNIWTAAGGRYVAYYQDFPVTVTDGTINIVATPTAGDAQINGFELLSSSGAVLQGTLIATISGTTYRWKVYSDNTYIVEAHNGTAWVTGSPSNISVRGVISGTSYRWNMTGAGTFTRQTFISGNWQ